jgi:hypothetical protein
VDPAAPIRSQHRVATYVGGAMVAALLAYALVAEVIRATATSFPLGAPGPWSDVVRAAGWGLGLVAAGLAPAVRRRALGRPPADAARAAQVLTRATVAVMAVCEQPGVFGLVLFLLWGSSLDLYGLLGISLFLLAVHFPRLEAWLEWARQRPAMG